MRDRSIIDSIDDYKQGRFYVESSVSADTDDFGKITYAPVFSPWLTLIKKCIDPGGWC
jgi:hypothetical protein